MSLPCSWAESCCRRPVWFCDRDHVAFRGDDHRICRAPVRSGCNRSPRPGAAADHGGGPRRRLSRRPVTIGTEVLGTIINMPVLEKATVRKGDLLVELRSDDVKASLREAHHRLTEVEVALRLEQVRSRLDRILPIVGGKEPQHPMRAANRSPPRQPGAMPPRRRSTGSRPSRPSIASWHRSTEWSSSALPSPAKLSLRPRP